MAKITAKQIKDDLIDQLERSGTVEKYFLDLVDDYMSLWKTKNQLIKDIKDRGVSVKYNNGGGQYGYKKNDSVDQILKVNQQMLKILDYLNIKPSKQDGDLVDLEM